VLSFACVIAIVLTYPTGRVDTRLRRIGALMAQVGAAVMVLAYLLRRRLQVAEGSWVRNPLHPRWLAGVPEAVIAVAAVALLAASALAIVSAVRTFRRSTGVERQQMRWFAWSALAMPGVFVFGVALGSLDQTVSNWVCFVAIVVGLNAIAVAIGIAVSRYRLYDIDRVVSRTIAYAAVSGVVVGGYVGLVALSESVLGFSSEITVAASTLTAAALFQPLRRHVQRNVDRRFDRTAYDARRTVDAFSTRLRDEVDVDTVTNDLLDTASSAVAPSRVSLWLVPA